jgi:hypothetical protein
MLSLCNDMKFPGPFLNRMLELLFKDAGRNPLPFYIAVYGHPRA